MVVQAILISIGAMFGALSRWQIGIWLQPVFNNFHLGTFIANVLGCFFIGIALGFNLHDSHKLFFITGFLGSFTTFSTFSVEIGTKILEDKWLYAMNTLGLHLVFGISATLFGLWITKQISG